jgi:hypothetical protein
MNSNKDRITFEVETLDEFAKMISLEDFRLSDAIIDTIQKNLYTDRTVINDIAISIGDLGSVIVLNFERSEMLNILEEHLQVSENAEEYERCAKIVKIIKQIKTDSLLYSLKVKSIDE